MDDSSARTIDADTSLERHARKFEFSQTLTPAVAVVEAVSDVTGSDPTSGPPLHDSINTDALNAFFTETNADVQSARISFEYEGNEITVIGDGTVYVSPAQGLSQ